jgi:hypothetical protein
MQGFKSINRYCIQKPYVVPCVATHRTIILTQGDRMDMPKAGRHVLRISVRVKNRLPTGYTREDRFSNVTNVSVVEGQMYITWIDVTGDICTTQPQMSIVTGVDIGTYFVGWQS